MQWVNGLMCWQQGWEVVAMPVISGQSFRIYRGLYLFRLLHLLLVYTLTALWVEKICLIPRGCPMVHVSTWVYIEIAWGQLDSLRLDPFLTTQFLLHCLHPFFTLFFKVDVMVGLQDDLLTAIVEKERLRILTCFNLYEILEVGGGMCLNPLF